MAKKGQGTLMAGWAGQGSKEPRQAEGLGSESEAVPGLLGRARNAFLKRRAGAGTRSHCKGDSWSQGGVGTLRVRASQTWSRTPYMGFAEAGICSFSKPPTWGLLKLQMPARLDSRATE